MTSTQTTTIATAYARANKLLKRALNLGIGKNGKPLNLDQAVELVAAEEGFRNRHAMDAKLKAGAKAGTPTKGDVKDQAGAEQMWQSLVHMQGWNEHSQMFYLEGFIRDRALMADFVEHVKRFASEACVAAALSGDFSEIYDQVVELLSANDYHVNVSDLGAYYGEQPDGYPTEDFVSEEAAWFELFCRVGQLSGLDGAAFANLSAEQQLTMVRKTLADVRKNAMSEAIAALEARWGFEHPYYDRADWQHDASEGNTKLGYWEWVQHAIDSNGGEDDHCANCGIHRETDEGTDTLCGHCADHANGTQEAASQPELDLTSYTSYSFSLGALTEAQLEDLAADTGAFTDHLSSSELRSLLLQDYEAKCRSAADKAFEDFDFGEDMSVEAANGWESSPDGVWKRVVFLNSVTNPEESSIRGTVTCVVEGLKVTSTAYVAG